MSNNAAAKYSPVFPLYHGADLVVQSSNGTLFATRAIYLRAASTVFDDVLSLPVGNALKTQDGHSLLRVEEKAPLVEIILRYCHPGKLRVDGKSAEPSWDDVVELTKMFDKYDTPLLAHSFLNGHLRRFVGNPHTFVKPPCPDVDPVAVFAVATIFGLEDEARNALRWHHHWGKLDQKGAKSFNHRSAATPDHLQAEWRPNGLGDLPLDLLSRMSFKHIKTYCELHDKSMSTPGYSWIKVGDDFRVSAPVLVIATGPASG